MSMYENQIKQNVIVIGSPMQSGIGEPGTVTLVCEPGIGEPGTVTLVRHCYTT
jgi:hypothetical protein